MPCLAADGGPERARRGGRCPAVRRVATGHIARRCRFGARGNRRDFGDESARPGGCRARPGGCAGAGNSVSAVHRRQRCRRNGRVWCSGSALAFQANGAGSIPATRSSFENAPLPALPIVSPPRLPRHGCAVVRKAAGPERCSCGGRASRSMLGSLDRTAVLGGGQARALSDAISAHRRQGGGALLREAPRGATARLAVRPHQGPPGGAGCPPLTRSNRFFGRPGDSPPKPVTILKMATEPALRCGACVSAVQMNWSVSCAILVVPRTSDVASRRFLRSLESRAARKQRPLKTLLKSSGAGA